MAYDEKLAGRIRRLLARRGSITERKMFGGLAFLADGRMCCGVLGEDLVVRVAREHYAAALARPHVRPMDFTGRPLAGFLFVAPAGVRTAAALARWVEGALDYAAALPQGGPAARSARAATTRARR